MSTETAIKIASAANMAAIRALSIITFTDAFGAANNQQDIDQYIAKEMAEDLLTAELVDTGNIFFLAYKEDVPVGFAKLRTTFNVDAPPQTHAAEIQRLYVLQAYQGQKIGDELMKRCILHARELGYDTVWLGVWEHNPRAIKFYERLGFIRYGSHPFLVGSDLQTDLLFSLKF